MSKKPALDYAPAPLKAKMGRYGLLVFAGSILCGVLLTIGWMYLLESAIAHRAAWVTHLRKPILEIVPWAVFCAPVVLAAILFDRAKRRLLANEIATEKAAEKWLREQEKSGIGWKVPKSAEAADWPKVVMFTAVLYVATFVAVLAICSVAVLIDHLHPRRHQAAEHMAGALRAAFLCANVVGATIPGMFVLMLLVYQRVRVTLTSEGVFERFGIQKKLISYAAIRKVRIERSHRKASLKCFAILAPDQRAGERWYRFDFGSDAPVAEITRMFGSKGLPVEIADKPEVGDAPRIGH